MAEYELAQVKLKNAQGHAQPHESPAPWNTPEKMLQDLGRSSGDRSAEEEALLKFEANKP